MAAFKLGAAGQGVFYPINGVKPARDGVSCRHIFGQVVTSESEATLQPGWCNDDAQGTRLPRCAGNDTGNTREELISRLPRRIVAFRVASRTEVGHPLC